MRIMYDTVASDAHLIPSSAVMVAGYINGKYAWTDAQWKLFPQATKIEIAIYIPGKNPPNAGHVLDVEAEDVNYDSLNKAAVWVQMRQAAGVRPTIYTSKSTWNPFRNLKAFNECDYWIGDQTHSPHLVPGSVATQYEDMGPYDMSVVSPVWYPPVVPLVPPIVTGEEYMIITTTVPDTDGEGNAYWDVPSTDAAKVVNAVVNCQDPLANGYPKYPIFKGACQVGLAARLVFEGGAPHIGQFQVRVVIDG